MSTAILDSPLMDAGEVGQIIGESRKAVLAMARRGEIGCVRRNARVIKFAHYQVSDYIATHEIPAKVAPPAQKPSRSPKYAGKK